MASLKNKLPPQGIFMVKQSQAQGGVFMRNELQELLSNPCVLTILNNMSEYVYIVDENGCLQFINPAEKLRPENLYTLIGENEKQRIMEALLPAGGNVSKAARALGCSRQSLTYRMKKHGIHR